jgi:hypothetical protein
MQGFLFLYPFGMVLVMSDLSFTIKTYNNERFTLHHRRYPYYRLGIWLFLLFCRRNNSRIISNSYCSFAFGRYTQSISPS